jgi:hypothetical protein
VPTIGIRVVPSEQSNHWKVNLVAHMDWKEESPLFDGTNYVFWNIRMRVHLQALGYDVWKSVVIGYTPSKTPPTDATAKEVK